MERYRFGYNPREINENSDLLVPEIIKMQQHILNNIEQEKLTLKILALMQGYMERLAYNYSKNSKKTTFEDYMEEMILAMVQRIPTLNLNPDSNGKHISSFLYYWLNDACQKHYADLEYATSISVSKAKKIKAKNDITEIGAISKTDSLNDTVKSHDDKIEYHETFTANVSDPMITLYKKELKRIILTQFGEKCYDSFMRLYVFGYNGTVDDRKRLAPFLDYLRENEDIVNMIQEIVKSGEGFYI